MITYFSRNEDDSINISTVFPDIARKLSLPFMTVDQIVFSPDGKRYLSAELPKDAEHYNLLKIQKTAEIRNHSKSLQSSSFMHDSLQFACTDQFVKELVVADNRALKAKMQGQTFSQDFICSQGISHTYNCDQIMSLSDSYYAHIDAISAREKAIVQLIESNALTYDKLDILNWDSALEL